MRLLFWLSTALITYVYLGYASWIWLLSHIRRRPILVERSTPSISVVIAARNEASNLPAKLENIRLLNYPADRLQVVVVSDGSTDRTADILRDHVPQIVPVILDEPNGKGIALNEAVKRATGDILVFLDARQSVEPNALEELTSCFADPSVGAVSGELLLDKPSNPSPLTAISLYWDIEKIVRKLESATGSVVGVTGAIYAIRRELYHEIPPGTILDDVFVPMHVARMGKRVVFQPAAVAHDRLFSQRGKEFSRKVRTLTGNYQLLQLAPWLLSTKNPLLFRFISHKVLRLASPFLILLTLLTSMLSRGSLYHTAFWMQIAFYALAGLGALSSSAKQLKPVAIASTFVMLNAAAALAFYNFIAGRDGVWH
ncbi:MAG: glycosyltransferase family 2 protein [Terracidiphilus sp.]|jgi:cellulose synthase/poly-beta-1,6-N-acetylglucosamine synthase-like glycosyltransferase